MEEYPRSGDITGDGRGDHLDLRLDEERPKSCRAFLVLAAPAKVFVARIPSPDLGLPITPRLVALAEIDGIAGLEVIVDLVPSPVHPYYEARGPVLHPLDEETHLVPFGEDPAARYPELRGEPFPSCPNRRG